MRISILRNVQSLKMRAKSEARNSKAERNPKSEILCKAFNLLLVLALIECVALSAEPPRLDVTTERALASSVPGERVELADGPAKCTLYLPEGWTNAATSNGIVINACFHMAPSFAIPEHARRNAREPLIAFSLGSGASTYRAPFEDTNRFARVLSLVERELGQRGGRDIRVAGVDVASFSAGYGAVRELVKSPTYFKLIRRIVLLDSMYGSLAPQQPGATNRVPIAEHVEVWAPFAKAAIKEEKTFVLSTSLVDTPTYASTAECTSALLAHLGVKANPVVTMSDDSIQLLRRADSGNFHVWSYSGTNAAAHLAHVQHMADMWKAVE
jgi:hypothetical protein